MAAGLSRAIDLIGEHGFVYGQSEAIQSVNAIIGEIAQTDIPVLLSGESGTGKDVYGKLIHQLSRQRELAMAKLNCTMLAPGDLLNQMRQSLEQAQEGGAGTLFLDGIDELDLDCQKVMQAMLQQQEASGERASLRLISTATRVLDREIGMGRFRRELYFRINGVCVKLPALRDRKADIVPLAEYFLERHAHEAGKRTPVLNADDEELLRAHEWPGNVRELENLARRIVALGDSMGVMGELQRPSALRMDAGDAPRNSSLKAVSREASRLAERDLILKALERTHWNRKQAAKQLQISYKALLYKIKQMEMPGSELKNEGEER
jgi:two-component system, NtrC family, response regulator AtoC